MKPGLVYVVSGELRVSFESMVGNSGQQVLLRQGDYLDHTLVPQQMRIHSVIAAKASQVALMPLAKYLEVADVDGAVREVRSQERVEAVLRLLVKSFGQRSLNKRREIVEKFKERYLEPNTLIEMEGTKPTGVHLLLEGQVCLYKRP